MNTAPGNSVNIVNVNVRGTVRFCVSFVLNNAVGVPRTDSNVSICNSLKAN